MKWRKDAAIPKARVFKHESLAAFYPESSIPDRSLLVDGAGGIQNVLIYISSIQGHDTAPSEPVVVRHFRCEFIPRVAGVRVGQKILLQNDDAILHTNHVLSQNQREYSATTDVAKVEEKTFEEEEVGVGIACDVHPWEKAYVGVFRHPYFTVSGADGSFEISVPVPSGRHKIIAWHERIGKVEREIDVENGDLRVDFELSELGKE